MSNVSLNGKVAFVAATAVALLWHDVTTANFADDHRVLRLVAAPHFAYAFDPFR